MTPIKGLTEGGINITGSLLQLGKSLQVKPNVENAIDIGFRLMQYFQNTK